MPIDIWQCFPNEFSSVSRPAFLQDGSCFVPKAVSSAAILWPLSCPDGRLTNCLSIMAFGKSLLGKGIFPSTPWGSPKPSPACRGLQRNQGLAGRREVQGPFRSSVAPWASAYVMQSWPPATEISGLSCPAVIRADLA